MSKFISTLTANHVRHGTRTVHVTYNRELSEYKVSLYVNGVHYAPADYFTNDLSDANGTARAMIFDGAGWISGDAVK